MKQSLVLAIVPLFGLFFVRPECSEAAPVEGVCSSAVHEPLPGRCVGCNGDQTLPTSLGCISVQVDGTFELGKGDCVGTQAPCDPQPCKWASTVTITVTNNCSGDIWVKNVTNGTCESGTVTIPGNGGALETGYDEDAELACGESRAVRIWAVLPPPANCSAHSVGWSFSCSGCGYAH